MLLKTECPKSYILLDKQAEKVLILEYTILLAIYHESFLISQC